MTLFKCAPALFSSYQSFIMAEESVKSIPTIAVYGCEATNLLNALIGKPINSVFNKKYVNLDASLSSYIYKGVDFIDCSNRDYSDIKATLNACVYAFNHSAKAGPLSSQELDFLTRLSSNGCGKIIVVVTNFESCSPTDLPLLLKGIRLQVKDIDVTNVQVVPVSSDFHFSGLEMGVSTLIDRSGIAKLKSIIKTSLIDVRNDRKARLVLSREKLKHAGALVYADLDKHVA